MSRFETRALPPLRILSPERDYQLIIDRSFLFTRGMDSPGSGSDGPPHGLITFPPAGREVNEVGVKVGVGPGYPTKYQQDRTDVQLIPLRWMLVRSKMETQEPWISLGSY